MEEMQLLSLDEAELRFPEAIARLRQDRSFLKEGEPLTDRWDALVVLDDELIFANVLDDMADFWDPVDGCWMEYLEDSEEFFRDVEKLLEAPCSEG